MLSNHTAEHYPFLGVNVGVTEMRCRSMFYTSLGRLLMVDLGEDEDKFDAFMLPLTTAFESLGVVLAAGGYNSEEVAFYQLTICNCKLHLEICGT